MCTALTFKTNDFYFGRTLDLDFSYGEEIIVTPRNYPFRFSDKGLISTHYAFIGTALEAEGYPLYYGYVRQLMEKRLAQIEHPVLPDMFFEKHHNCVVVKAGCDREEILHGLALQMTRKMRPQFVVDDNHKLIGFALSPQLIIAGVSALGVWPSKAAAIVAENELAFLSQSEAKCVTRQKDLLCEMMREAGVPDISQLESFPLHVVGDDWVVDVWSFCPDDNGKHFRCTEARELRFLAKI